MIILNAIQRYSSGTNYSRRIRNIHHLLPGVVYRKKSIKNSLLISLTHDSVFNLQKKNEFYLNNLLLIIKKKKIVVRVQEIQRHAFKPKLLHIDFIYMSS